MIDKLWNTVAITCATIPFIVLAMLVTCMGPAHTREHYPGQWAQADPWFRQQQSPSGYNCCSESDYNSVDEDIRKGEYWVRWDKSVAMHPETGGWMKVPEAVIIPGPNKYGPAVWWAYSEESGLMIRCYVRGPLF